MYLSPLRFFFFQNCLWLYSRDRCVFGFLVIHCVQGGAEISYEQTCASLLARLRSQLNLWLKGCNKSQSPVHLHRCSARGRDTIRAPASNYLPSLSIRVPWRVLKAGGITGRWSRISLKTSLKTNNYFQLILSCLIRTLYPGTPLDLPSAIVFSSLCLVLSDPYVLQMDCISRYIQYCPGKF